MSVSLVARSGDRPQLWVTSADDPTTATVNDGDRPGLEGTGNEFSPQRSYTGREPDPATGLIYYRARWFDPKMGRFISEDPIGFAVGDANLSRYVGNSTPNAVDPSGLDLVPLKDGSVADDSTIRGRAAIAEIGLMFPPGQSPEVPPEFLPPKQAPRPYSSLTVAVTDGEDPVTRTARWYNFGLSEFDLTVPPEATASACLDAHTKTISRLPGNVEFAWVVFTGHGNPGKFSDGGHSVFDLPTLLNPKSSQVLFLEELNKKCSEHTIIDLRLCNIARGADGQRFLIQFSELTGCRVIGYTDVYAVLPHGDAYMAHPDGKYELIESFPPYAPSRPFDREIPEQVPVEVIGRGSLPGVPGPFGVPAVPSRVEGNR